MGASRSGRGTSRGARRRATARLNDSTINVVTAGTNPSLAWDEQKRTLTINTLATEVDHGAMLGLADDDHTQYALATAPVTLSTSDARMTAGRVLTAGTGIGISNATPGQTIVSASAAGIDHGSLAGLADDDHAQYATVGDGYITYGSSSRLTNERVLTAGTGIGISNATPGQTIVSASASAIDHNSLSNLTTGNVHTQYMLTTAGTGMDVASQVASVKQLWTPYHHAPGRLTLVTGNLNSMAETTAATTIYYEPYIGQNIGLYDGSTSWGMYSIGTGISLSLSGLASTTNFDIWCYNNSGTPTLEALAWTNSTTRATALTAVNGIWCKSGDTTRRLLGTFRTTGTTGQTESTRSSRLLWNLYNRLPRPIQKGDTTVSWTYGTAAWRQMRADTANKVEFIQGLKLDTHIFTLGWASSATSATSRYGGIGINSTTPSQFAYSVINDTPIMSAACNSGDPGTTDYNLGLNTVYLCEWGSATGTVTFYGQGSVEMLKGVVWQ